MWIFAWLSINETVSQQQLWGLQYYTFAMPAPIVTAAGLVALASGLASLWILVLALARRAPACRSTACSPMP